MSLTINTNVEQYAKKTTIETNSFRIQIALKRFH